MTTSTKGSASWTASGDSAQPVPTPSHRVVRLRKALVLGAIAAVLAVILGAAGATLLARGQVDELDRQVSALTSSVSRLTAQVDVLTSDKAELTAQAGRTRAEVEALTRQNTELRAQIEGTTGDQPVVATVSYDKVVKDDKWFIGDGGSPFLLIVDVTVSNPDSAKDAYFSTYDFRLKGPDDTVYPLVDQSPVASQPRFYSGVSDLPGGRIQVQSQQLAPSETVKGCLVFYVPKPVEKFSITYHGTTTALAL